MSASRRAVASLVYLGATLTPARHAAAGHAHAATAQATLVVQGRVTDEARNPIAGAQLGVEGGTAGAVSNDDGTFRLTITQPRANTVVLVRRIGYRPQRVTLTETSGSVTRDFSLVRDV